MQASSEAAQESHQPEEAAAKVGDAAAALASAPVTVDSHYETPTQHHNPIELFTTTAEWNGNQLTIWEPSQNMYGFQFGIADQLGIDPSNVRVISPFVGGAFGSRGSLTQRTALVALAAKRVGRPVRLEATRSQGFTIATYRAETRHRVRLGAGQDGKLQALIHEGWEVTSRPDNYKVAGTDASTRLYACPNVDSAVHIVHADRNTPGFMRSPPELPYMFALESAMDELAVQLKMDPVELRRVNDTQREPIKGLPYTSRHLMECFDQAARRVRLEAARPAPGSMRDGDWLVGWGCATTCYPTQMGAGERARAADRRKAVVRVQTATHEIGTGVMTALALTAASGLGVKLEQVQVEVGDTDLPPSPVAGGSNSTASVCTVVAKACDEIRDRIALAAVAADDGPFKGVDPSLLTLRDGALHAPEWRQRAARQGDGARRQRRDRGLCREHPARRAPRRRCRASISGKSQPRGRRQDEGPHPVRLRRAIRRGARQRPHPRNPRAAAGRRLCGGQDRQPEGGEEPADGRPDLGRQRRTARGDRDRPARRALLQRRPRRILHPGQRRRARRRPRSWSRKRTTR